MFLLWTINLITIQLLIILKEVTPKKGCIEWLKRLWHKHHKVAIFFVSNKLCWTILFFIVLYFCTDMIFGRLLKHAIEKSSNYTYEFQYGTFRYNLFTDKVIFKDAYLYAVHTADTIQPIRSIKVEDIYLKGFGFYSFFIKKEIDFSDLSIRGTTAHINLHKNFQALNKSDSLKEEPSEMLQKDFSAQLKRFFKERSKRFGIEKFNFENASFYLHNTQDSSKDFYVENFNLKVDAIFINDSVLQRIDSSFFFKHFEFSFGKNNWNYQNKDNNWHIGFDSLYYSSKNKRTVAEMLSVENIKEKESIDVNASFLAIENLDFEKILNEEEIKPDTLKIKNSNINVVVVEKEKQKTDSSALEKLLQKIYPISLKHIALEDNTIAVKYVKYKQAPIFFKSSVNLYLDDIEIDKKTYKERKNDLFSKNYSIHLSKLESSQQGAFQVYLNNFEWNSNQKELVINDLEYHNLSKGGVELLHFSDFKLMDLNLEKLRQEHHLEAFALIVNDGCLYLKELPSRKKSSSSKSTSLTLPDNKLISGIKLNHVEIEDFDFKNRKGQHQTIDVANIDLEINQLNMNKNRSYSLFDVDFCKTIAVETDRAQFYVNDDFYKVSWNRFNTDVKNVLKWQDIAIQTATPKDQLIKQAVILPPQLIEAYFHDISIKRFNIPLFVKYGILQIESIDADSSNVDIYKTVFPAKDKGQSLSTVFIESIMFKNGNINYENADSRFKIRQYQLDVDFLNISDFNQLKQSAKFNNFVFQYASQEFINKKVSLETKHLKLDHQQERLSIGNIFIKMKQDSQSLQELKVNVNQLKLNKFDYRALFFDRVLYASSLSTQEIDFEGLFDNHFVSSDSIKSASPLEQILIRSVSMKNIKSRVSLKDTMDEQYQMAFKNSFVKAQNVNWKPDMKGFPHHGKLDIGLRQIQGEAQKAKKSISIDSLNFSLLPDFVKIYNITYKDLNQKAVCPSIHLENISVFEPLMDTLFISKKFKSKHLLVRDGFVELDIDKLNFNDTLSKQQQPIKKTDQSKEYSSIINDIFKKVSLRNIHLKIIQEDHEQHVVFENGILDEKNGSTITIGDMHFLTNQDLVNTGFKNIFISSKHQRILIDSFYSTPILSKEEWGAHFGYQKDWTNIAVKSIILEGVNLDDLINQDVHRIPFVRMNQLELIDYRDKRLPAPENHFPGMPQDMLRKVIRPFLIDSMVVSSSLFSYEEQVPYAIQPGKINFSQALISASNITNAEEYISEPMLINASMLLMDTTKLTGQLSFALDDTLNSFHVSAQLESIYMPLLNPVLENLAFLSIKEGMCNSISMDFHGNKHYALGSMLFKYKDFKIGLIDKKKLHPDAKTNLLSFLANTFVVRRSNPVTLFPRTGIMYFEPDPHKSIFNYLFKTALSGIKHTIGLREQKAKNKDSENYSVYSQERKKLISDHKRQKKLEKKLLRKGVDSHDSKKN